MTRETNHVNRCANSINEEKEKERGKGEREGEKRERDSIVRAVANNIMKRDRFEYRCGVAVYGEYRITNNT